MSQISTELIEFWTQKGFCFQYDQVRTLPSATNLYFLFDPSGIDDDILLHVYPLTFINVEDGPAYVNYYVGHDYTGGTPVTLLNRNGNSTNTAKTVIYEGPTGTSLGLKTSSNKIAIGGAIPAESGGGSTGPVAPFIASKNITFLIEIVNDSGDDIDAEAFLEICEVPQQYN